MDESTDPERRTGAASHARGKHQTGGMSQTGGKHQAGKTGQADPKHQQQRLPLPAARTDNKSGHASRQHQKGILVESLNAENRHDRRE